ncbi:MAG: hypothetical protein WC966_03630 [Bradymonadales bacterium]
MDKFFASPVVRFLSILSFLALIVMATMYFSAKNSTNAVSQTPKPAATLPKVAPANEAVNSKKAVIPHEQLMKDMALTILNDPKTPYERRAQIVEEENLFVNSGFEQGLEPWTWLSWSKGWSAFVHSQAHAYEGEASLLLPVLSVDARQTVVWGGVQEVELKDDIPECLEGYYYVQDWIKGDWKQYLQVVLIDLSHNLGPNRGQAQLRYIVSGEQSPPLTISNAQYLFVERTRREHPVVGKWTKFSMNPRKDFMNNWSYVPSEKNNIRVLFEARYDGHKQEHSQAKANVYYDNLYLGPKTATRCNDE